MRYGFCKEVRQQLLLLKLMPWWRKVRGNSRFFSSNLYLGNGEKLRNHSEVCQMFCINRNPGI